MESEFKVKNPTPPTVPFMKLMIQSLRKQREEHPVLDTAAGFVPFVGGVQAGMDMLDTDRSPTERSLAALQVVPGGKLLGKAGEKVAGKLGIVTDLESWRKKQKVTAEALRKQHNQSVQAEAKVQDILQNVDKIDTSGPERKLPANVFFKDDKDYGDFLMGGDKWEERNLKWNDKGELKHPTDGWIGPDHPDYLEPLSVHKQKVEAYRNTKPYEPEEIFQKPDLVLTPEQRAANLKQKNDEAKRIAEQWLKDNPQ